MVGYSITEKHMHVYHHANYNGALSRARRPALGWRAFGWRAFGRGRPVVNITFFVVCCFCISQLSRCVETAASGVQFPVEVTGGGLRPVIVLETLNSTLSYHN